MKTTTRRATSLSAAVTLLSSLALPAMAADAPVACEVVDKVLVCAPSVEAPVEEPAVEEPAVEEPAVASLVACEIVDAALVCAPTPVVEEPDPAPSPAPAPAPAPAVKVELPLSLDDDPLVEVLGVSFCAPVSIVLDVVDCADRAVFLGDADGNLQMGNLISRGQAAAALVRLLDLTDLAGMPSGADHFEDDNGTVHEAAINRVVDFGILRGTVDGMAHAGATVTGTQFTSMLHRTLVHTGTFETHVTTHTAAAEDLAAIGIHLADGELTRGAAVDAMQALLDQLPG